MDPKEGKAEEVSTFVKNKKVFIVVGIVALAIIGYTVNGFIARKFAETAIEGVLGSQLGGKVNVNAKDGSFAFKTEEGNFKVGVSTEWPTDIPSEIPKITAGKLTMAASVPTGWQVVSMGVSKEYANGYIADLTSKGWKTVATFDAGMKIVQMNKDKFDLTISFGGEEGAFSLTVSEKK